MTEDKHTEDEISPADGAAGVVLTPEDKGEVPAKKAPKSPKTKKTNKKDDEIAILERRLADLEEKMAGQSVQTHVCHMCHKNGASIQRGNTGEYFHKPCLEDFKQGKDPIPA